MRQDADSKVELRFVPAESTGTREAARDVFPGCPLTFQLTEAMLPAAPTVDRVVWSVREARQAPPPEPAWETTVTAGMRGDLRTRAACLVPRSRRWHVRTETKLG